MSLGLDPHLSQTKGQPFSGSPMLFVSYSRKDEEVVRGLIADLEKAHQTIWLDQDLRGGEPWWQEILQKIRGCTVFVFALSNSSLGSKPCLAELAYARDLGLPILPVQVGSVNNLRTAPISEIQIIDYRERTAASGIYLVSAIHDFSARRRELPSPLPEPPPVPFAYLLRLRSAIEAAQLSPVEQSDLVVKLRECLETEQDQSVHEDAKELLRLLRRRSDVTYRNVSEIDSLLANKPQLPTDDASAAGKPQQRPLTTENVQPSGEAPSAAVGSKPAATGQSDVINFMASTEPQHSSPDLDTGFSEGLGTKRGGNALSIAGIILGAIAVLFLPIIFGPAGIICAAVGRSKKQPLANIALAISIGGTILGVIFGVLVGLSYS